MKERSKEAPGYQWFLYGVGGLIALINGYLSFVYSSTYLANAFAGDSTQGASLVAGLYGLLIFDVAFLAWLWANMRLADSKAQRDLSLSMAAASLFGSTMATITQLGIQGDLIQLDPNSAQNLGMVSLAVMLVITTGHIVAFTAYFKLSPKEKLVDRQAKIAADIQEKVLDDLEAEMEKDVPWLVEQAKMAERNKILTGLGYDRDGNMISDGNGFHGDATERRVNGRSPQRQVAPPHQPTQPTPYHKYRLNEHGEGGWQFVTGSDDLEQLKATATAMQAHWQILNRAGVLVFFGRGDGIARENSLAHQNGSSNHGANFT